VHLSGTKKIQQILSQPGVLSRFIPDPEQVLKLTNCFTDLYPLDSSPEGLHALKLGLENPMDYVMKPQREGGGNNIYGLDIKTTLEKLNDNERNAFILMKLIKPPVLKNMLVRKGKGMECEVVSELGVYGIWVSDGSVCYLNEAGGHLLRTKTLSSNEGGVAAGFAVLDSPYLV
jgi:glutathione synthetase